VFNDRVDQTNTEVFSIDVKRCISVGCNHKLPPSWQHFVLKLCLMNHTRHIHVNS